LIRSGLVCYTVLQGSTGGTRASGPLAGDTVQDLKTILLGEDHPNDVEPTLEALADYRLANDIVVVNDGEATLDYPYRRGRFAGREPAPPAVALLDLKIPKVDGLAVLHTVKADPALKPIPS
jgi:CheY-like chemotaxis protein